MKTHVFVALSATSFAVPASADGRHPAERQIVALGMLTAHTAGGRRWRFARRAAAIGAGDPDGLLLQWLVDNLPSASTMIGWQLDSHVMPMLIDAAEEAPAATAQACMNRLAAILGAGAVDLALDYGGATAPPLVQVAADHGVGTSITTDDQRCSHWAVDNTRQLRVDAADEALGLWRLFLRMANTTGFEAEAATEDWLRRRRRIRAVSASRLGSER